MVGMHIHIIPNRNSTPAVLLRESYRVGGNVRKRTLANLSKLPMDAVDAIRRILKGEKLVSVEVAFKIVENGSLHHGHVDAVLSAMRQLGFEKLVGSRHSPERDLVVAMVVARILEPQSKLATSQWWHTTTLPEILGVSDAREDDLYAAMDWVLKRQEVIEKKLAARHLHNDGLALYDLTSSYFEGVSCPIARLGYDRDGKKGKLQINYGLLTNERGIPVSVSVFEGNTGDPKTLLPQVEKVQERFGIEQFVMVGDRGMITQTQIDELREMDGVDWITALRPEPTRKLINDVRQLSHPFSEAFLLSYATMLHWWRRDGKAMLEAASEGEAISQEQGYLLWEPYFVGHRLAARNVLGEAELNVSEFVEALDELEAMDARVHSSLQKCQLGEGLRRQGRLDESLICLNEALAFVRDTGEAYCEAEIFRQKGLVLVEKSIDVTEAESCFRRAIEVAQNQGAKLLELRAATSLGEFLRDRGRSVEAQKLLSEIYGWFTEGFDTADLVDAKALLDELSDTTADPSPISIAVVPLRNLSTEKDTEYFSDGLSEDIILDLSQVSGLRVISRSSAMRLKGTEKDLRSIGAELHVDYVLEGSVRRSGDDIRITVQLVDVSKDAHVWGDRFSGSLENVFTFQEEISRKIVEALRLTLSPVEERRLSERPIDDVQAYDTYLKARRDLWSFTADGLERAERLLQNALDRVGPNALLYAAQGMVQFQYVNMGARPPASGFRMAEEYCEKAFTLRPDSPDGQFLHGLLEVRKPGGFEGSIRLFKQCLAAQPSHSDALYWIGLLYLYAGRTAVARPYIEALLELDPLSQQNHVLHPWSEVMDGRFEEGIDGMRSMSEMDVENPIFRWFYSSLLARLERRDEALSVFAEIRTLAPGSVYDGLSKIFEAVFQNDRASAVAAIEAYTEKTWWGFVYSWEVAGGYALLGETEEALRWLRNAVDRGFINYPFLNEYDPFLENLRGEKAFQELMKHVRERWESFDA